MLNPLLQRTRTGLYRLQRQLHIDVWFPHVPLAVLLGLGGQWLLQSDLGAHWLNQISHFLDDGFVLEPRKLPPLLVGGGMLIMAFGLLLRSRIAWVMALLLAFTAVVSTLFATHLSAALLLYFAAVIIALLISWRHFDRSSVAASTLFALTSVAMLLMYAAFGSFYLGAEFKPPITDLVTALYYSMVTMTTVGYGDVIPQTPQAKLFTISIIVMGVAVFATSLTAVIAPLISNSLQRIVHRKGATMKRENHFIVIGNSSLAINTWHELVRRGRAVTRILREPLVDGELSEVDVVIGDPSDLDVLKRAGADKASAVLAMQLDDSENAFVVLAVKELHGSAQTVAAVNDARHLSRVKLVQPDVVIAPQVLGGELTAMLLSGEAVTPEFVMERVFQRKEPPKA